MKTIQFFAEHIGTIVQLSASAWMAYVARQFQVAMAMRPRRLDAHQEAVRRGGDVWWLAKGDPNWCAVMNEMRAWLAMNEVYLEPAAVAAFNEILLWKGLQGTVDPQWLPSGLGKEWRAAQKAREVLRDELLRFRKRPLIERLRVRSTVTQGAR